MATLQSDNIGHQLKRRYKGGVTNVSQGGARSAFHNITKPGISKPQVTTRRSHKIWIRALDEKIRRARRKFKL